MIRPSKSSKMIRPSRARETIRLSRSSGNDPTKQELENDPTEQELGKRTSWVSYPEADPTDQELGRLSDRAGAREMNCRSLGNELAEGANSGTNLGDLAGRANSGTNLGDLAERANSGINLGDLAERANLGTNLGDLAERANSGTNLGDLAERVNSGTNLGDLAERANSGRNFGDSAETANSGTNLGDLAERANSGTNLGDLAEMELVKLVGMTSSDSSSSVRVISSPGSGGASLGDLEASPSGASSGPPSLVDARVLRDLEVMKADHDLDTAVTEGSLAIIRERYSISAEYGLHVPRSGQRPYSSDAPGVRGGYYLIARVGFRVNGAPSNNKGWKSRYLFVSGPVWGFTLDWSAHPIGNVPPYLSKEESVLVGRLKGILSSSRAIKEMTELWLVEAGLSPTPRGIISFTSF
ncbi:hypothetical protein BHM03_00002235 [Ensete ventricosum]|nr:hypothetical protein BHM03_00002235 [Ensete ventricosum]